MGYKGKLQPMNYSGQERKELEQHEMKCNYSARGLENKCNKCEELINFQDFFFSLSYF